MDRAIDRDAAIAAALQDIEDFAVEIAEKHELPVGWDSKKVLKHLRALPALSTLPVAGDGRIHEAVSTVGDLLRVVLKRNQGMYIGDKDDIRAALRCRPRPRHRCGGGALRGPIDARRRGYLPRLWLQQESIRYRRR